MGTKGVSYDAFGMAVGMSHYAEVLCVVSEKNDIIDLWEKEASLNENFSILKIKVANTVTSGLLGILNVPLFLRIKKYIDKFSPDFVYSFMGHPWERMFVPYLKCKNVLSSIHDAEQDHGDKDWRRPFMNFFNYNPKWYVAYSQNTKKELVTKGYEDCRIIVSYLACNVNVAVNECNLNNHNRFLFWGRIEPYKGLDILLDSVEGVFRKYPKLKLVIAGRGDLSAYQDKLKLLKQNVEIYNSWISNEQMVEIFDSVDFVVAPYKAASQSGVITVAYSFGKPVIASNSGALPEQVLDGVTGLIVPTGDVTKFTDNIISLYDDNELLKRMKQGAVDYSKKLTWDGAAKIILTSLEKLGAF
jgi:glycosyltransferase involved in cell wall biosynthesis